MDVGSQRSLGALSASDSTMPLRVSVQWRSSHPPHNKQLKTTSNLTSATSTSSVSESLDPFIFLDLEELKGLHDQSGVVSKGDNLSRRDSGVDCSSGLDWNLNSGLGTGNYTATPRSDKEPKSKLNMLPSHQPRSQSAGTPIRFIDENDKPRYSIRNKEIIATNNPTCLCGEGPSLPEFDSTWSPNKYISAHNDAAFTKLWDQGLGDDIVNLILATLPDVEQWCLSVFRLGYDQDFSHNPIVITITVGENDPAVQSAIHELISSIAALPTLRSFENEVYVDVCRSVCRAAGTHGKAYSRMNSSLYSSSAPCTGYSIGPKDVPSRAGSFTCFIKHGNTVYGLTNEHVARGAGAPYLLPTSPYAFDESDPAARQFRVSMPAVQDHIESLQAIQDEIDSLSSQLQEPQQDYSTNRGRPHEVASKTAEKAYWEMVLTERLSWNTDVGHIVATSGQDKVHSFLGWSPYQGRLDWAIFTCNTPNQVTQFPGYSTFDGGSFRIRNFPPQTKKKHGAFLTEAAKKFNTPCRVQQPRDYPPEEDETLFKVASRTSGFREAKCTGIQTRFYNKHNADQPLTKEYCFIPEDGTMWCSEKGDSGAILFDQEFRPVAMMWGGHGDGGLDTTYATPLVDIFRHIEHTMGWEQGSVSLA